jgi:hypothetical protein
MAKAVKLPPKKQLLTVMPITKQKSAVFDQIDRAGTLQLEGSRAPLLINHEPSVAITNRKIPSLEQFTDEEEQLVKPVKSTVSIESSGTHSSKQQHDTSGMTLTEELFMNYDSSSKYKYISKQPSKSKLSTVSSAHINAVSISFDGNQAPSVPERSHHARSILPALQKQESKSEFHKSANLAVAAIRLENSTSYEHRLAIRRKRLKNVREQSKTIHSNGGAAHYFTDEDYESPKNNSGSHKSFANGKDEKRPSPKESVHSNDNRSNILSHTKTHTENPKPTETAAYSIRGTTYSTLNLARNESKTSDQELL